MPRRAFAAITLAICLLVPGTASAKPLGLDDCGPVEGTYQCSGLVESWDGVPLDVSLTLPRAGVRRLPLVAEIHGFGNSKWEYMNPDETAYTDNVYSWAKAGYAVLTYTARGLWGSCGTPESRLASPVGCARGYIHLADIRYEVRDTQELIGRLVDDGVVDRGAIGVTGDSYGGGQSLMLAALRDRVMKPDGSLVRWRSPEGVPLRIAAAAPVIPWTDLVNAAAPNGTVLSHAITPRAVATAPVGVEKASFVNGIFAAAQAATGPGQPLGEPFVPGRPMGYLAPAGDPEADVAGWVARTDQGEPYDEPRARAIVDLLARYHSAYYVPPSRRPPPLMLASGFTDDLFPVDETVRYANRALARYPGLDLKLFLGDFGHQRASNEPRERARLLGTIHNWFDHYLRGSGRVRSRGVTAYVQRCPRNRRSGGPFRARSFDRLARGEVRLASSATVTVRSDSGDPAVAAAVDPVAGMGDSCVETQAGRAPGTAVYDLEPIGRRYTLVGAATAIIRVDPAGVADGDGQIAARLWDVAPNGQRQRLVARGLWRPRAGRNLFQLHPGAWTFERGHTPRLELAGRDAPYARPSNGSYSYDVRRLQLRLPVRRRPDCKVVQTIRRPPLVPGTRRAPNLRSGAQRRALSHCRR